MGLASAIKARLGGEIERQHVSLRKGLAWLPPQVMARAGSLAIWSSVEARTLLALAKPDLLIGAGRRSAPVNAALRAHWGCIGVQWLDPKMPARCFDLVLAPAHDGGGQSARRMLTTGSLHHLTPAAMAATDPRLAALPEPRIGVLIGGPSRSAGFEQAAFARLTEDLAGLARQGAGLMVSASRRTPEPARQRLRAILKEQGGFYWDGSQPEDGANPYFALIGMARALVVTADSVNMASEAAASGKPVFIARLGPLSAKLERFQQVLQQGAHALALPERPALAGLLEAQTQRLDDMERAVDRVSALLAARNGYD
ncbi:MAG: mitochondrial fission ELM1 family protein [Neomegalonema sp.]|nr:mitochondrial fission ELM1 family protein [Neomegalonema sp.]